MESKTLYFPVGNSPCGDNVTITFAPQTLSRLSTTCFRGTRIAKAGNFFRWESIHALLRSPLRADLERDIMERVVTHERMHPEQRRFEERFDIDYERPVGWSSTMPLNGVPVSEIERFQLNDHAVALRVRPEVRRLAPLTSFVTFVYVLVHDPWSKDWIANIYSVYPGEDIGPLRAENGSRDVEDISLREDVVFFSFDHPGGSYRGAPQSGTQQIKRSNVISLPLRSRRSA